MISVLRNLSGQLRALFVAALACLTICSGLSHANASVIAVAHLAQGEQMLPDGGWTAACDFRIEHCTANGNSADQDGLYGFHHHHHADFQFGTMMSAPESASNISFYGPAVLPGYAAVIKAASPAAADQPPKI